MMSGLLKLVRGLVKIKLDNGTKLGGVSDAAKVYIAGNDVSFFEYISFVHQKVHDGDTYQVGRLDSALNDNSSIDILVKVGANKTLHTTFGIKGEGDVYAYLFEAPTTTADGTALTPFNLKRSSTNTTDASIYHTPTITSDGTELFEDYFPGGAGGNSVGGQGSNVVRNGQEIILKKSTNYIFRVTNKAGQTKRCFAGFTYYESAY